MYIESNDTPFNDQLQDNVTLLSEQDSNNEGTDGTLNTLSTQLDPHALLSKDTEEIAMQIVQQKDPKQVKDLVDIFNLNHTKKQVLRSMAADQLLDSIMDQAKERVTKRGDQFSNKDLLDYMNTMANLVEKSHKQLGEVDLTPAIQINQQNNISVVSNEGDALNRESAQRVLDFVKNALQSAKNDIVQNSNIITSNIDENESISIYEENNSENENEIQEENFGDLSLDNLFKDEEDI